MGREEGKEEWAGGGVYRSRSNASDILTGGGVDVGCGWGTVSLRLALNQSCSVADTSSCYCWWRRRPTCRRKAEMSSRRIDPEKQNRIPVKLGLCATRAGPFGAATNVTTLGG